MLTRRTFLGSAAVAGAVLGAPAIVRAAKTTTFRMGHAMPPGHPYHLGLVKFKEEIEHKVDPIANGLFIPFFFVSIGLHVSFDGLSDQWLALVVLCVLAVLTKLIGAGLGARITGFGGRSSLIIGSGMVSRGEVALIIAALGLGNGLVPLDMYTTVILVIVFTTLAAPPMLKWTLREPKPAVMRREEG